MESAKKLKSPYIMDTNEPVLPLILFLIHQHRERLGQIFDCLEARGFQVLLHRLDNDSTGSALAALYDSYDLRLLVYPFNGLSDGSDYGITNDSFSYVKALKARGVPVMSVGMSLGGPFDDEIEIFGKAEDVAARMFRAMNMH